MSELVLTLIPQPYHHSINADQLPDFIREVLFEKGCTGDFGINYTDGDFDLPVSYEQLEKEFGPILRDYDEVEEGDSDPFDDFLESIPEPYYRTNCKFLICFRH